MRVVVVCTTGIGFKASTTHVLVHRLYEKSMGPQSGITRKEGSWWTSVFATVAHIYVAVTVPQEIGKKPTQPLRTLSGGAFVAMRIIRPSAVDADTTNWVRRARM